MKMVFPYQEYYQQEFSTPMFSISFALPILIVGIIVLFRILIKQYSYLGFLAGLLCVGVVSFALSLLQNTVLRRLFAYSALLFIGFAMVVWMDQDNGLLDEKPKLKIAAYLSGGIIAILFSLLLIISNINILKNGGFYLSIEKEWEAERVEGVIENTEKASLVNKGYPDSEGHYSLGEFMIIKGQRFYLMTSGNLKVGDSVIVTYLPKSKYVLEIEKSN